MGELSKVFVYMPFLFNTVALIRIVKDKFGKILLSHSGIHQLKMVLI